MKLLVSLMVLVTVAKGDDGVAREEMSRVLNRFMRDVSREMRIVKETMATMAAKVDVLETEVTSIKQICRVQTFSFSVCRVFFAFGRAAIVLFTVDRKQRRVHPRLTHNRFPSFKRSKFLIGTKMWKARKTPD